MGPQGQAPCPALLVAGYGYQQKMQPPQKVGFAASTGAKSAEALP